MANAQSGSLTVARSLTAHPIWDNSANSESKQKHLRQTRGHHASCPRRPGCQPSREAFTAVRHDHAAPGTLCLPSYLPACRHFIHFPLLHLNYYNAAAVAAVPLALPTLPVSARHDPK